MVKTLFDKARILLAVLIWTLLGNRVHVWEFSKRCVEVTDQLFFLEIRAGRNPRLGRRTSEVLGEA